MSLENILQKTKKAFIVASIPFTFLTASHQAVADRNQRVTNNYRVDAEDLGVLISSAMNFANASFTVNESSGNYVINGSMRGMHYTYHSRLNFRVEGNKVNGRYMPRHYELNYTDDTLVSSDGTKTTIIDFDYVRDRAISYSYRVKDGQRTELYDTRPNGVSIDDNVKDMISAIMDLRYSDLNSSRQIRTIISGRVKNYNARFRGNENISIHGADMECAKYSIRMEAGVIDRYQYNFTFWIGRGNSRTPLKMNIRPGSNSLMAWHTGTIRE